MRNLYVSDLDGTLLRSNEATSEYTNSVINSLVAQGMIFSYATARSLITAKKVTRGIEAKIPLIVFGDGKNDIDMFQMADESYAVANAEDELKKYATDVILSNDEDGVAKWLVDNYQYRR